MVYASDPGWLPEEPERIAMLFSSLNPWMVAVDAHAFCVPGAVRAAVFTRPGYVLDQRRAAWFGYWESTGDRAAEELVMAEVRGWARAAGAQLLVGPIDFSTVLHCRALLSAEPGAMLGRGPTRIQARSQQERADSVPKVRSPGCARSS